MPHPRKPPLRPPTGTLRAAVESPSEVQDPPDELSPGNKVLLGTGIGAAIASLLLLAVLVVLLARRGCDATGHDSDGLSASPVSGGDGQGDGHGSGNGRGQGNGTGNEGVSGSGVGVGESLKDVPRDARGSTRGSGRHASPESPSPTPAAGEGRDTKTDRAPRPSYAVRNLPSTSASPAADPVDDREGGIGGGAGGGGADFFGIKARGNKFVYIIDCSGSMAGQPFQKAADELRDSLKKLRPSQRVFVILFDSREYPMFHPSAENRLLPATPANNQQIDQWVRNNLHGGGTDPQSALLLGLQLKPDVIFLLTDGGFSPATVDVVTRQNNGRVAINTIGFMDKSGEQNLQQIAQQNRGKYRFVP